MRFKQRNSYKNRTNKNLKIRWITDPDPRANQTMGFVGLQPCFQCNFFEYHRMLNQKSAFVLTCLLPGVLRDQKSALQGNFYTMDDLKAKADEVLRTWLYGFNFQAKSMRMK